MIPESDHRHPQPAHHEPRIVELNDLLARIAPRIRQIAGREIDVVLRLDPALDAARVDAGELERAILKLAATGCEAMPRGGKLVIAIAGAEIDDARAQALPGARRGPYVVVALTDSGSAADESPRARFFEPFAMATERGPGELVARNGGFVTLERHRRGRTFRVHLPRADGAPDLGATLPHLR